MQWAEVIESPYLRNLPFKIETNRYGQIVMSPASVNHGRFQSIIVTLLSTLKTLGDVYSECPIKTPDGVKVPDIAWASEVRSQQISPDGLTFSVAPEVCVEVLSRSNRSSETVEKQSLYFQQGAEEVWVCDLDGNVTFFDAQGEIPASRLFPAFPKQV